MSDGDGGIKGAVVEAIIKPVKDEVGKVLEVAGQSVSGRGPTPQQTLQKQAEDQKKIIDIQRRLQWWRNIEAQQKGSVTAKKQEDMVKSRDENQKAKVKQFEIVQRKQSLTTAVRQAQTKTEIKGRVGG